MYVEVNGARLFFDVIGPQLDLSTETIAELPVLLMLHGGPGYDHTTLRPHFDRFSDTHQVVYIDHRGCGRSTGNADTWSLDQWADDISVFCAKLGIEKPVVFGQSFGGMVAMRYAVRYPRGLSKLILSSTAARFLIEETVEMVNKLGGQEAALVARELFENPSLVSYEEYASVCLPLYSQTPPQNGATFRSRAMQRPEVTVHFFDNEMRDMDMRADLAEVACPTLVLAGAMDPVTPVKCSEEIAQAIGENARLEIFEGCGHGVYRDNPDGSDKTMRAFLQSS